MSSGSTPPTPDPSSGTAAPPPAGGVTRATLMWFGLVIVVLAFFAAFLGSWMARAVDTAPTAPVAGQPSSAPTFITRPPGMPSAMKWPTETPASAA